MMDTPGSPSSERPPSRRRAALVVLLAAALVVLVVISLYGIVAPRTYRIAQGETTLRLSPVLHSGQTVVPLGPAGSVGFRTHRTPLEFSVAFVFNEDLPIVEETRSLVTDLPGVGASLVAAFKSYALSKIPWVCILGLAAGALVAGVGTRRLRRMSIGAAIGLVAVWVAVGAVAGITYATVDRSPDVTYEGLAEHAPRVMTLLRSVLESPASAGFSAEDFARGLQEVARQATSSDGVAAGGEATRLLVAGDLHDNVVGYRLLSRLAADKGLSVDGVVLLGDLVHVGTAAEARFLLFYLRAIDQPVVMVGGNHENAPAMRVFKSAGIVQLDGSVTHIGGVSLMGFADPLADEAAALTDIPRRTAAAEEALMAFRAEVPTPDVAVFHDGGQARNVIDWAQDNGLPLVVLHGHDHVQAVEHRGTVVILDPGSGGASGYEELGRDPGTPYQFQIVEFSGGADPQPLAAISLSYQGAEGQSTADYQPLTPQ
jgi:predicted phosphodiesterase